MVFSSLRTFKVIMSWIENFLTTIYLHFLRQKERGRNVVPWLMTCFIVALSGGLVIAMLSAVVLDFTTAFHKPPTSIIMCVYGIAGIVLFILTKSRFFSSGQ